MRDVGVSPVERRDRAIDRLRAWTVAAAAGAAGLVALFSILAASTFPGHSAASTSTPAPAQQSAQQSSGDPFGSAQSDQPQAPPGGFLGSGDGASGGRGAVSGGS